MNTDELQREFVASLGGYVREDEEGGLEDERESAACEMALLSPSVFVDLMYDVPHDVAAVFSCCVRVARPNEVPHLSHCVGESLRAVLASKASIGELPLTVKPGHPAEALFAGLLESVAGCELYRNVMMLLSWASSQRGIRVHLFGF